MSELEIESPDDPRMLEDYRPFSFISVAAALLGFLSCLAIINPSFIILPFIAAAVAILAIVRVEWSSRRPVGGWLAYLALGLACFSAATTLTYRQLQLDTRSALARKFAEQWLDLVRDGQLHRHYELTQEISKRQANDVDLVKYYRELKDTLRVTFDYYKLIEPEASLRRAGKDCDIRFTGFGAPPKHLILEDLYFVNFEVDWRDPERGKWQFQITMKRQACLPPYGPQWSVPTIVVFDPVLERKLPYGVEAE